MLHVDDLRTRAGSLMLTLRCEVTDTAGAPVLTSTLADGHRGGTGRPGRGARGVGGARVTDALAVGDALPPLSLRVTRAELVRYAGASGDFNPIHWSDRGRRLASGCPT